MENSNFKSGFVSMLGRTNVGKSSIINALVGETVAAVANKTQTTRTAIRAIVVLVVWTLFATAATFSPTKAFIMLDLPTLVLPSIDTNPDLKISLLSI